MESKLTQLYENYDENSRLLTRQGNVEFVTTMHFIGRYSHTLARRGFRVDAVELV